jgi:hypothetical protein
MSGGTLTPREALEELGFRIEVVPRSRGVSIEVVAPGGVCSWRERATWLDSPAAAEYVTATLLREAESRAARARALAATAERDAVAAEADAARLRGVAGRVRP